MGRELLRITLLASPIPAIKLAWHWPLPTSWYTALMMDGDQSRYQVRLRQQHELCILCSHPAIVSAGLLSFSSVVQALSLSRLVAWYMTKDFSWWDLTWSSTVLVWPTLWVLLHLLHDLWMEFSLISHSAAFQTVPSWQRKIKFQTRNFQN